MDYEEDDDVHFAKWMSSYWGHNGIEASDKHGRANRKRQTRILNERRSSLPCPAQLSAMHVARLHSASKVPASLYLKDGKEIPEDKDFKVKIPESSRKMSSPAELLREAREPKKRSNSIQELSEYFERQLRFRSRKSTSSVGTVKDKPVVDP